MKVWLSWSWSINSIAAWPGRTALTLTAASSKWFTKGTRDGTTYKSELPPSCAGSKYFPIFQLSGYTVLVNQSAPEALSLVYLHRAFEGISTFGRGRGSLSACFVWGSESIKSGGKCLVISNTTYFKEITFIGQLVAAVGDITEKRTLEST